MREATPFCTHDAPLVISSDEEEGQDNTSPTSPLTMREDTPQPMNTSPSHQCTLLLVMAQMAKNSAASLTWYLQQKRCHQSLTTWMTQGMKLRLLSQLMSIPTKTVFRTRTDRKFG